MTRILAIEDEAAILENIIEILDIEDYEMHGAPDGLAGVEMAHQIMPDLILCDVKMPHMDGFSVLMEMRSNPQTTQIPFIFLTAFADKPFRRRGMNLGAADYLTKPFTASELIDAVQAQLKRHEELNEAREHQIEDLRQNIVMALPHELRTPLTGIITCADMLLMDYDDGVEPNLERTEQMIRIMHKSGLRLHHLVENYLIYAQLEVALKGGDRQNFVFGEGIQDVSSTLAYVANQAATSAGRSVAITQHASADKTVRVTEQNLEKIVTELVSNAFKFSEPETVVTVADGIEEDAYVFRIRDEGRGMTAEQIKQIGAYMQFDRRIYEQQGMGLGLIIAKRLAELHEGQLKIESEPGVGTKVTVRLPLMETA